MTVGHGFADAGFSYVLSLYRCPCGREHVQHGRLADTPPPGWVELDELDDYVCPECARAAAGEPGASPRPPA